MRRFHLDLKARASNNFFKWERERIFSHSRWVRIFWIWKRLEWITNKTCLFYNKWLTIRWGAGVEFLVPFKSWCHNHNGHALQLEITAYMGPIAISDEEKLSPLMFWKQNEQVYPYLSILARVFLTPSASSVPVESLFSITGITKNSRRSSLASYRLNKLTFVHDNYHLFFSIGK